MRAYPAIALVIFAVSVTACTTGEAPDPGAPSQTSPGTTASPPTPGGLDRYYGQELEWSDCADGFECSTLIVPLDYANPEGETLEIAVNRLPASGEVDRVGSLVVNPGGPGASGLEYARSPDVVTSGVLAAYDLVGFDPRGVGSSSPIDCLDDAELDEFLAMDGSPDDDPELDALDSAAGAYAAACEERSGDVLPFLGTVDVAHDLDVLRAALGDDHLNFLGKSYGTYIGAVYAEQFPDRVGRLVLDGAVDPAMSAEEAGLGQARGFDQALRAFLEDCQQYLVECPFLDRSIDEAVAEIGALLDSIDADPMAVGDRELTESLAVLGVAVALYDQENGWPYLRLGLTAALGGDGETLLLLSDVYTERQPDGSYGSNSNEAFVAISCVDSGTPGTLGDLSAAEAAFEEASPVFGDYLAYTALPCAHWPVAPTIAPHEIAAAGAAPILVVGTTRDPATPYEWAASLAGQLQSGVLLTLRGDGHTAYQQGSICIDEAVDAYLLDGQVPEEGTRC